MTRMERGAMAARLLREAAQCAGNLQEARAVDKARGGITQLKLMQAGGSTKTAGSGSTADSVGNGIPREVADLVTMIGLAMTMAISGTRRGDTGAVRGALEETRDLLTAAFVLMDEEN